MLKYKYINFVFNDPLSRFPHGGKALFSAPSPMGEGWEGGIITYQKIVLCIIPDTQ